MAALSVQNSRRGKWSPTPCASASWRRALTQAAIGSHSARDYQRPESGRLQGTLRFDCQRFDYRGLECECNIGARLLIEHAVSNRQHRRRLQSTEAEIEIGAIQHRPRQLDHSGMTPLGKTRQGRATWVRQAEELGGLIERLAGGIVERLAQQSILAECTRPQ